MQLLQKINRHSIEKQKKSCAGDPELEQHYQADVFIISHPKSGRTWLRFMLAKYLSIIFEQPFDPAKDISEVSHLRENIPYVAFSHDFSSITNHKLRTRFNAENLPCDKTIYRNKKVVLLVRDLRDVMVSYFFDCTQRNQVYSGELSEFIRDEYFGIAKAVNFLNNWYESRKQPKDLIVIKYEDIVRSTLSEFLRIIHFLEFPIEQEAAKLAIEYGEFSNMQRMERDGDLSANERFGSRKDSNQESYKVRRGKAFGFTDYLTKEDIVYLTEYINLNLSPFYGYTYFRTELANIQ